MVKQQTRRTTLHLCASASRLSLTDLLCWERHPELYTARLFELNLHREEHQTMKFQIQLDPAALVVSIPYHDIDVDINVLGGISI